MQWHVIFICVEAILIGAPHVDGLIPPLLGRAMFLAGIAGLFLYPAWVYRRRLWVAWRWIFRWRLRWPIIRRDKASEAPMAERVHVYRVDMDVRPLASDKCVKITLIGFNGTPHGYQVGSVAGSVGFPMNIKGKRQVMKLPKPSLSRMPWGDVKPYQKFAIELEQRVESKVAKDMLTRLGAGDMVEVRLEGLTVPLESKDKKPISIPLALWDAMSVQKTERIITGQIIEARGTARVGASITIG